LGRKDWIIAYPSAENEKIKWESQSENDNLWFGIKTGKPAELEETKPSV